MTIEGWSDEIWPLSNPKPCDDDLMFCFVKIHGRETKFEEPPQLNHFHTTNFFFSKVWQHYATCWIKVEVCNIVNLSLSLLLFYMA